MTKIVVAFAIELSQNGSNIMGGVYAIVHPLHIHKEFYVWMVVVSLAI